MSGHVLVVGGGVIGLMSAWYLRRDGHEVTVVERETDGSGCSYGNAGLIVPSHFVPLAAPGAFAEGFRWMLRGHSPFSIRPRPNPAFLGWARRFARACTSENVQRSLEPLYRLNSLSHTLYRELSDSHPDICYLDRGLAVACRTEQALEEEAAVVSMAKNLGILARLLEPAELTSLQDGTEFAGSGAAYYESDASIDPRAVMETMRSEAERAGVHFHRGVAVTGFASSGGTVTGVLLDSGVRLTADSIVLAAGSWTPGIARQLGIRLFIQPGKGYGSTIEDPPAALRVPVILSEEKVAMTPYPGQLRVVGTVEAGAFGNGIRWSRVNGIFSALPRYFPSLDVQVPREEEVWHGFRSLSHDGRPYIGRHPSYSNLTIATGHAMFGMSAGPATGLLVSEIVAGRSPSVDIRAFAVDR